MIFSDLIKLAYYELQIYGPADTVTSADIDNGVVLTNLILDTWNASPSMVGPIRMVQYGLTTGVFMYSIGPGQTAPNFASAMPPRIITRAQITYQTSGTGPIQELDIINLAQYADLQDSTALRDMPTALAFSPEFPAPSIFFNRTPDRPYPVTLYYKPQFAAITATTTVSFPPGYAEVLKYELAIKLCPIYGVAINSIWVGARQAALAEIKRFNIVNGVRFPDQRAPGGRGGMYDIYSNQVL